MTHPTPWQLRAPLDPACARHITRDGRSGEVCMVLQRPDGRIWCAAKTFYPAHISRLLTGGVHPHEDIERALRREIAEETSLTPLTTTLCAHITYDSVVPFSTAIFLCAVPDIAPIVADPNEQILRFDALTPAECAVRADELAALPPVVHPDIGGTWQDWGVFRAVAHRVVAHWYAQHGSAGN
jgi:8-oxo-dGTP pyrophosphatase MutT (NUDIX family)